MILTVDCSQYVRVHQDFHQFSKPAKFVGYIEKFTTCVDNSDDIPKQKVVVQLYDVQSALQKKQSYRALVEKQALRSYSFNIGDFVEFVGFSELYAATQKDAEMREFLYFQNVFVFEVIYTYRELCSQQNNSASSVESAPS